MCSVEAAIAAIESLEPGEKFLYTEIANRYGCNRTTLARRHQGVSTSSNTKAEIQLALHPHQEQAISGALSESDSYALSTPNWRKTESLLHQVVKDRRDPQAQKLS